MTEIEPDAASGQQQHTPPSTSPAGAPRTDVRIPPPDNTITQTSADKVDILILGAGWLWQFLQPLLRSQNITYAATSTSGHDGTIEFKFDPASDDLHQYRRLPDATTVLITFPLATSSRAARKAASTAQATQPTPPPSTQPSDPSTSSTSSSSAASHLVSAYTRTHPSTPHPHFLLLGSTGEWSTPDWHDRHSQPSPPHSPRWESETALLNLGGCVLHLAGLFGDHQRTSRIWDLAVPRTKEGIKAKGGVHFIHGGDVARAIVAVHRRSRADHKTWEKHGRGQRWIVTDGRTYDWWALVWEAGGELDVRFKDEDERWEGRYRGWVLECMREDGVRGLPREGERLGRRMDSREFWETWGVVPLEKGFAWPQKEENKSSNEKL